MPFRPPHSLGARTRWALNGLLKNVFHAGGNLLTVLLAFTWRRKDMSTVMWISGQMALSSYSPSFSSRCLCLGSAFEDKVADWAESKGHSRPKLGMVVEPIAGIGNRPGRVDFSAVAAEGEATNSRNTRLWLVKKACSEGLRNIATAAGTIASSNATGEASVEAGDISLKVALAAHLGNRVV